MKELTILLLCVLGLFVYTNFIRKSLYLSYIESDSGKKYLVRNLPDNKMAANYLDDISKSLKRLVDAVKDKKKDGVDRLYKNFDPDNITENIPGSTYNAYSVNKGEELSICIREKNTEKFIDKNTLMFVAIHELSHMMSIDMGHTKEFWDNMKYLLNEASKLGIYSPVDYSKNPVMYCGMKIDNTPLNL